MDSWGGQGAAQEPTETVGGEGEEEGGLLGGQGAAQEPTGEQGGEGKEECGLLGRHKAAQEPTEVGEVRSLLGRMREKRKEREKKEKEEEEEKLAMKKKKKKGKKEVPEPKKEESPAKPMMMKNWLKRKEEEKTGAVQKLTVDRNVEVKVVVENVESDRIMTVENPDKNPDSRQGGRGGGVREVMKRFKEKADKTDSYEEWKRRKVNCQAKRKAEQVDSEEGKELVMAGKPKRLKNISIPPRGIHKTEKLNLKNFIAPTCSSIGGDGQVARQGAVDGGSGDNPDDGATSAEQQARVGVWQNLQNKD